MKDGLFSLLMDETTDIGTEKQEPMVVKCWDNDSRKVKTWFYDMKVLMA
jgi:hypothetical protein